MCTWFFSSSCTIPWEVNENVKKRKKKKALSCNVRDKWVKKLCSASNLNGVCSGPRPILHLSFMEIASVEHRGNILWVHKSLKGIICGTEQFIVQHDTVLSPQSGAQGAHLTVHHHQCGANPPLCHLFIHDYIAKHSTNAMLKSADGSSVTDLWHRWVNL